MLKTYGLGTLMLFQAIGFAIRSATRDTWRSIMKRGKKGLHSTPSPSPRAKLGRVLEANKALQEQQSRNKRLRLPTQSVKEAFQRRSK